MASTTTTTVALVSGAEAVSRLHACLSEHDVAVGAIPLDVYERPRLDLLVREIDFGDPAQVAALTSCSSHLAAGALVFSGDPATRMEIMGRLSEFSRCLRGRGVEGFPNPLTDFAGVGSPYPVAEIPYDDPDLATAVEMCTRLVLAAVGDHDD